MRVLREGGPFQADPAELFFYKGKRVCVTGATGLIGSYAVKLIEELAKRLDKLRATKGLPPYTEKDYLATLKD